MQLAMPKCRPLLGGKLDYQHGNHHGQDLFLTLLWNLLLEHVLSTNELDRASSDNVEASLHQWMRDIASPIFLPEKYEIKYLEMQLISQLITRINTTRNSETE